MVPAIAGNAAAIKVRRDSLVIAVFLRRRSGFSQTRRRRLVLSHPRRSHDPGFRRSFQLLRR
jgi:hypothetical protein